MEYLDFYSLKHYFFFTFHQHAIKNTCSFTRIVNIIPLPHRQSSDFQPCLNISVMYSGHKSISSIK